MDQSLPDIQSLRPAGGKRSSKRDRILEIFLRQKGHLSADDLVDIVHREAPGIGRATVYRTLQWMVGAGIARKVDFGEGRSRYEPSYRHPRHYQVVDGRRELIAPVAVAIANDEVAALFVGFLLLRSASKIDEAFDRRLEADAQGDALAFHDSATAAGAWITAGRYLAARTRTRVDQLLEAQMLECTFVDRAALALADWRSVRRESEPREIFEEGRFVFRATALPIVILDPQEDAAAARACDTPDDNGVDDMSEVEIAGRRRRKPRYDAAHYDACQGRTSLVHGTRRRRDRRRRCPGPDAHQPW